MRRRLPPLPEDMLSYYARGLEAPRLTEGHGPLELARVQEIIGRHLCAPPQVVLDVGGGPGRYARWLASLGHEVHLVDPVPLHVEQAAAPSRGRDDRAPASATLGDARRLRRADRSVDAVLLLGPLYHLTRRADRVQALAEARRVLRPGGVVLAAAISRYASLFDGLFGASLDEPGYARIVERDLRDGQHRNPTPHDYFTRAFFHRPDELRDEVEAAGLELRSLLGVEGPGWLLPDLGRRWDDPARRRQVLDAARAVEAKPELLGLSAHLLAVALAPRLSARRA